MTHDDGSPFFIAPHRFDEPGDGPVLDRRHEPVLEPDERLLWQGRLRLAGYLLGPTEVRRRWALAPAATVTVTDRRVVHVSVGAEPTLVGEGSRHRHRIRPPRLASGQIRWQWPSRLELPPAGPDQHAELLIVCDALRTIQQPALGLGGSPGQVTELARLVRRAVAGFRLAHPTLVELSPPERDTLLGRAATGPFPVDFRVTLPGSLPVEFLSRDDYYAAAQGGGSGPVEPPHRPGPPGGPADRLVQPGATRPRPAGPRATGRAAVPGGSAAPDSRPGSAC